MARLIMVGKRSIGLLVLLVAVAVVSWWCFMPSDRITQETAAKIQKGMTEKEVIEILRVESGDYLTISLPPEAKRSTKKQWIKAMSSIDPKLDSKRWLGNEGEIVVSFDREGKVAGVAYFSHDLTTLDRILGRLPLR
jgi:hypothetical protein